MLEERRRVAGADQGAGIMAAPASTSLKCDKLRERGNILYSQLSGTEVRLALPIRRMRFTQAHEHYVDALKLCRSPAERATCLKNIGALHVLWSKLEVEEASLNGNVKTDSGQLAFCKSKILIGVDCLLNAVREGADGAKPQAWLDHLQGVLLGLVDWALVERTVAVSEPTAPLLRCLCEGMYVSIRKYRVKCEPAIIAHLRLAEKIFQQGILKLGDDESEETRDFKRCLADMHECLQLLRKAADLPANCSEDIKTELLRENKDLQGCAQLHIFLCESMQARETGDEVLRKAVLDQEPESINMDLVLQAVDSYHSAALLTRQRDIESEAIAMSRLGRVYSDVIKDAARASKYHHRATILAQTVMSPRVRRSNWYVYSSTKNAQHQHQLVVQVEDRQRERDRSPTKKQLQEEMWHLEHEARKDAHSFLRYIYQQHPNPDPKKQPGDMLNATTVSKETLRKAISHYHPDVNKQHGPQWQLLCQEICKALNNKYEYFKLST